MIHFIRSIQYIESMVSDISITIMSEGSYNMEFYYFNKRDACIGFALNKLSLVKYRNESR